MTDRAARQWFELAFASSPSGMLLLNSRGVIELVNDAAARMFGWRPHELAHCAVDVLVAPASHRKLQKLQERFARGGRRRLPRADVEVVAQHREGRTFKVAVSLGVVDGDDGPHVLLSVANLARHQRTEARMRSQNDALRAAVTRRSAELEVINTRLLAEVEERRRTESELRAAQRRLQEMNEELRRLALIDDLTGIANRRLFEARFATEYQRAARSQSPLSVVLLDIDHFKSFNDHLGHPAGDSCLRHVAAAIARCLRRPADLVARFGGEEFVALLPETPLEGATQIARAMRHAVRALAIKHPAAKAGLVTLSAGVASLNSHDAGAPHMLLEAADRALYTAKARGRDRVCVAMPSRAPAGAGEKEAQA
jgi:diguanylate cyclase (GGDEF)-like protein/PAS domain S-box-containing protein